MKLPNFLIAGAAKCGTTSLYKYLQQHPEVFMPNRKEPNYFCESYPNRAIENDYKALFASVTNQKAIGEASTPYLYDATAPEKIFDYLGPSVRIIILIRNPVDMAYALWGHLVREGGETLSFLQAMDVEVARLQDENFQHNKIGWLYNYAYFDRARFALQISRYIKRFGRLRVKVYVFEEFFGEPHLHFKDLCQFLDIDDTFLPKFEVHNTGYSVRSQLIQNSVMHRRPWKEPIKLLLPTQAKRWLKRTIRLWNIRTNVSLPGLQADERAKLWTKFEDDINTLEKILGRRLNHVWQKEPSPRWHTEVA